MIKYEARQLIGKVKEDIIMNNKMKKIYFCFGMAVMSLVLLTGRDVTKAANTNKTVISEGVKIGTVNVGGMSKAEATEAVNEYVNSINNATFVLKTDVGSINATAEDMSITADVEAAVEEALAVGNTGNLITRFKEVTDLKSEEITVSMHLGVDKQKTAMYLYNHADKISIQAENNTVVKTEEGFEFVKGKSGKEVDIVNSVYAIDDFISNQWDTENNEIELVSNVVEPEGNEEDLKSIKDVLGKYSTDFSTSSAGRSANVKNACSLIDGTVLLPGEEFSTYKAISPIDETNGYELAGAYENGQVVESVGGGVCQVATTLYNAVIRAELDVSMRYNHSMIVNYVPASGDAAIAGTYKDFRFVNNYDTPIYIEGYCSGGIINFVIYGKETRDANRSIEFKSVTISETDPGVEYSYNGELPAGTYSAGQSAHKGVVAELYKVVTVDGVVQSEEKFNHSTYKASPKTVTIGTMGIDPGMLAQIEAAAAAQDDATVKALCAQVAGGTTTPTEQAPVDTTTPTEQPAVVVTPPAENTQPDNSSSGTTVETPTTPESGNEGTTDTSGTAGETSAGGTAGASGTSGAGETATGDTGNNSAETVQ